MKFITCVLILGLGATKLTGLDCSGSRKGCSPCYGGRKSPELNREYYLPPSQITWRDVSEEELKENDRKASISHMTQSFSYSGRGIERLEGETRTQICDGGRPYSEFPSDRWARRRSSSATTTMSDSGSDSSDATDLDRPTTLCDRLRLSLAGICTSSRWVWVPAQTGYNPLKRQNSFVDDEQPGLRHRTEVVDTRKKRVLTMPLSDVMKPPAPKAPSASLYPYKSASAPRQMVSVTGGKTTAPSRRVGEKQRP